MSLLSLFERNELSYCGSSSYKHVDKLLKKSRNVLIVSPYIDDYYAEFILSNSRGKTFHIVSSSMKESAAMRLQESKVPAAMAMCIVAVVANVLFASFGAFYVQFAAVTLSLSLLYLLSAGISKNRIYIRTPKGFVHAKMYIGDSEAIEGSANLTYQGMHRNVEKIRVTGNEARMREMKDEFWRLWRSG
jgi:phosphatidylserine/phosphatidylglycerophosphate/cardiolipin synthase-like enzyme